MKLAQVLVIVVVLALCAYATAELEVPAGESTSASSGDGSWLSGLINNAKGKISKVVEHVGGIIGPCKDGQQGACIDTKTHACSVDLIKGKCDGKSSIKCCTGIISEKNELLDTSDRSTDGIDIEDMCFPLEESSYDKKRPIKKTSFTGRRPADLKKNATGCHGAVDVRTAPGSNGNVVSMADGVVTNILRFYTCGEQNRVVMAVLVYHPSMNKTVNYGEVNQGMVTVKVNETIIKGQKIGHAGYCGMLHVEVFEGRTTQFEPFNWHLPEHKDESWCIRSNAPAGLKDPYAMLKKLETKGKYCTAIDTVTDGSAVPGATPPEAQNAETNE